MNIGNINFRRGLFLAPLSGIGDHPFRSACASFGAEGVCSELISSRAACYGDKKTFSLAELYQDERSAAIQLFGNDPGVMARAAALMLKLNPDYIDINMGCPVPKVVKNGDGSALMKNPALCRDIVRSVKSAIDIPVTVKIRAGFDANSINATEVAKYCEDGGADAVFVHARTREQMYSGKADWNVIAEVKKSVSIPVIGNGDVKCGGDAARMLSETGCDGVMIGRGAFGAPWVFACVLAFLDGRELDITAKEKRLTIHRHIDSFATERGARGMPELRRHLTAYARGFTGSALIRARINECSSAEEFHEMTEKMFEETGDDK